MKKKSNLFKILIAVIAAIIVGGGIFAVLQKEPKQESYPKTMRVIYFDKEYINNYETMKPFYDRLNSGLLEYMKEKNIEPETYVADGSTVLVEKGAYNERKNRLYIYIAHTNPTEIKMIEEKIKSYPEVEEVREKERPTPFKPDTAPRPN